jgi:hypothetical protein
MPGEAEATAEQPVDVSKLIHCGHTLVKTPA